MEGKIPGENRNDWLTVAAISLAAMCIVTFDHEALGHGSACLFLHGHITLLTSSLFRCDVRSGWIDPAGPAANLVMGLLALIGLRFVPRRLPGLRLLLVLVTAFSWFWEAGYVIHAMHQRNGDLYFFAQFLLVDVTVWQRWLAAGAGVALYILAGRVTSASLLRLWPGEPRLARAIARTAWLSATAGAALAALAYTGHGWGNLRDAILETGAASFPLLFLPLGSAPAPQTNTAAFIRRDPVTIGLSAIIYAAFFVSMGRGVVS
jgi:hypothetical protein